MASEQGAKIPFINDYKLQFFWRRFPQTLSGGLRLKLGVPCYVDLYQVIVFLFPVIIGGIFTVLAELEMIKDYVSCYIYGGFMGSAVICVQLLRLFARRHSNNEEKQSQHNVLAEDDDVEFTSCCSRETFEFIFPAKTYTLNIFIHGIFSGVMCGLSFLYLLPSTIQNANFNAGESIVLLILGWLTLCIANYSLTVQPPPEIAIFRPSDNLELNSLTRPLYVVVITLTGALARNYQELEDVNQILYVIMVLLPVLWLVGLLPPLDALFSWLGEQVLVLAFGGTYMASDFRLFIALLISGVVLLLACFMTNYMVLITYSAFFGFLLSLDLFQLTSQFVSKLVKIKEHQKSHQCLNAQVAKWIITLLVCVATAGISSHLYSEATSDIFDIFGYIFIMLFVILKIVGDLQYVYICSGLIRNPLYIKNAASSQGLKKFQLQMRYLGHFYNILQSYVCPLIMVAFLGVFLNTSPLDLNSFATALGATRALRWVWQNTLKCLLELIVLCVIAWCDIGGDWWNSQGVGLQLLLIGLFCDRLNDFFQKATFMLTMFVTSWTEPKQRHKATVPTLIASLVLFPCLLLILILSVAISAPLKPLFCFPIFFVGFPRPKRMWPSLSSTNSSTSEDSVFYKQLVPKLCLALRDSIASGTLLTKSDFFLARYQDRFVIIQVLEKGYKYCTVIVKGLELQETSCHTVEASMVDNVFEEVFCQERNTSVMLNQNVLNTMTPMECMHVDTYSDAHNILTGVIDLPENIQRQSSNFMKCLIWVLLNHKEKQKQSFSNSRSDPTKSLQGSEHLVVLPDDKVFDLQVERKVSRNFLSPTETLPTTVFSYSDEGRNSDIDCSEDDTDKEGNRWHQSAFSAQEDDPLKSFGFPAQDIGKRGHTGMANIGSVHFFQKHKAEKDDITKFSNFPHTKVFPVDGGDLADISSKDVEQAFSWANLLSSCRRIPPQTHSEFPEKWFYHVLRSYHVGSEASLQSNDNALFNLYKDVVMRCFAIVNMFGLQGNVLEAGARHIYQVYHKHIPWSPELDLIEHDAELMQLIIAAFRYAFKLTTDEAVLGRVDDEEELLENLKDYEKNWFIGTEQENGWNEAVLQEKPYLFSIGYDSDKGTYTSHLLTKQELVVYAARLNSEAVRGQWASLAMELFYLTNDDEERYSIQAHPVLLRNLTIQAADPPLGYAVYSSGPVQVPYGFF